LLIFLLNFTLEKTFKVITTMSVICLVKSKFNNQKSDAEFGVKWTYNMGSLNGKFFTIYVKIQISNNINLF